MSVTTKRLASVGSAVAVIGLLFVWTPSAGGEPLYAASIQLNPTSGSPGTSVAVAGSGWDVTSGEIHWDSLTGPLLGTFQANPNRAFMTTVNIPGNAGAGQHTIVACQYCAAVGRPAIVAKAPFTVTGIAQPPPTIRPPVPPRRPTACDSRGGLGETVVDFEDFSPGQRLDGTTLPQGITFVGDDALVVFSPAVATRSPSRALMNDFGGREFGSINIPIRIRFTALADFVGVFVGLNERIWADEPFTATLTAYGFDESGHRQVVGSDVETLQPRATPINVCLSVEAVGRIYEVTIDYSGVGGVAEAEVIDDLVVRFSEEPPPLPEDDLVPVVTILEPEDGVLITDPYPRLQGEVVEDREVTRLEVWLNGELYQEIGATPAGYTPGGDRRYLFGLNPLPVSLLQPCSANEVQVRAYDGAGNEGSDAVTVQLLVGDLELVSAEAVQVVHGAPLVKGKATAFRVTVNSTYACDREVSIRLDLPEDEWSTRPPRTGLLHTGVPPSWEYPDTWGPYTVPGGAAGFEVMLPLVPPGQEDAGFDLSVHPYGLIHNREAAGVLGPDVRVVPRPMASRVSFHVALDPGGALDETDEMNNDFSASSIEVVGTREWRVLFFPAYVEDLDCGGPVLGNLGTAMKAQIEYLLATYPIADDELSFAIAPVTTSETCGGGETCGWSVVWEQGLSRDDFLVRIAEMARGNGYDFAVGVDCGGSGGSIRGYGGAVVIGRTAGMTVLAHEFNHAQTGIRDVYSLDCQAGWDEAYCEYADGSREYCCYVDGWVHPDGSTELNCAYDDAGEVVCEERTKECVGSCNCSIYHQEPPAGWTQACYQADASGNYGYEDCDAGCCADVCRGICPGGQVFNGPDGRIRHPASEGFWVNRWIPAGEGNNYFMDIPSAGPFPGFWMRLRSTSDHCSNELYGDGMLAMLASPTFRSSTDPQALMVSGSIHRGGSATLRPFYVLPEAVLDLGADSTGDYAFVIRGASGEELGRSWFSVVFEYADPNGGPVEEVPFVYRIQWIEGAARIELVDAAGRLLAAREVSERAPSVRVLAPNGGETWSQARGLRVRWEASDLDGDELTYSLSISYDAGETWLPLATDLSDTTYTFGADELPVGDRFLIRVRATDGVNTAEDISDAVFSLREATQLPIPLPVVIGAAVLVLVGIALIGYAFWSRRTSAAP